jgi:hypothetical protein
MKEIINIITEVAVDNPVFDLEKFYYQVKIKDRWRLINLGQFSIPNRQTYFVSAEFNSSTDEFKSLFTKNKLHTQKLIDAAKQQRLADLELLSSSPVKSGLPKAEAITIALSATSEEIAIISAANKNQIQTLFKIVKDIMIGYSVPVKCTSYFGSTKQYRTYEHALSELTHLIKGEPAELALYKFVSERQAQYSNDLPSSQLKFFDYIAKIRDLGLTELHFKLLPPDWINPLKHTTRMPFPTPCARGLSAHIDLTRMMNEAMKILLEANYTCIESEEALYSLICQDKKFYDYGITDETIFLAENRIFNFINKIKQAERIIPLAETIRAILSDESSLVEIEVLPTSTYEIQTDIAVLQTDHERLLGSSDARYASMSTNSALQHYITPFLYMSQLLHSAFEMVNNIELSHVLIEAAISFAANRLMNGSFGLFATGSNSNVNSITEIANTTTLSYQ